METAVLCRSGAGALLLLLGLAQSALAGSYESGGKLVVIDEFVPAQAGKRPAIILLHGSGGLFSPGFALRQRARDLSAQGYAVFLPHFFNRTGHLFALRSQVHPNLPVWTATVRDALTYVAAQPHVDGSRIALTGFSLGGYLSLSTAAQDRRVDAVIIVAGALEKTGIKRMPPTLILHGAQDRTVPVEKAERLEALLKRLGTPYQKHIYPGEEHDLSREAMRNATQRINRFLKTYFPAEGSAARK